MFTLNSVQPSNWQRGSSFLVYPLEEVHVWLRNLSWKASLQFWRLELVLVDQADRWGLMGVWQFTYMSRSTVPPKRTGMAKAAWCRAFGRE